MLIYVYMARFADISASTRGRRWRRKRSSRGRLGRRQKPKKTGKQFSLSVQVDFRFCSAKLVEIPQVRSSGTRFLICSNAQNVLLISTASRQHPNLKFPCYYSVVGAINVNVCRNIVSYDTSWYTKLSWNPADDAQT